MPMRDVNMKKVWIFSIAISFTLFFSACGTPIPGSTPPVSTPTSLPTNTPLAVGAAHPCIGAPAPAQWHHIVVLMFENKTYDQVIVPAPYITGLANQRETPS